MSRQVVHYADLTDRFDWMDKSVLEMIQLLPLQEVVAQDRLDGIEKAAS